MHELNTYLKETKLTAFERTKITLLVQKLCLEERAEQHKESMDSAFKMFQTVISESETKS